MFAAATRERRAIVTIDARGFRALVRDVLVAGGESFGLVLVPPGRPSSGVPLLAALDQLLRELPADDDLIVRQGGEVWLGQPS